MQGTRKIYGVKKQITLMESVMIASSVL